MSEATAVAEAPETLTPTEPETPQVEVPAVEPAPTGDTGQQETVDAAPPSGDLDSEYEAYRTEADKESGTPAPEPAQQSEPEQPQIDPRVYATRKLNYETVYRNAHTGVEASVKEMTDDFGVPETTAKRWAKEQHDRINELHAHGLNFHGLEAATQTQSRTDERWMTGIRSGIEKALPKPQLQAFDTWMDEASRKNAAGEVPHSEWMGKLMEFAREGYVKKDAADVQRKNAWKDGRRAREDAGEVGGASSGKAVNGAVPDTRSDAAKLLDPATDIKVVRQILARQNGEA